MTRQKKNSSIRTGLLSREQIPHRMKILYTKVVLNPPVDQTGQPAEEPPDTPPLTSQEITNLHLELVDYHLDNLKKRSLALPDIIFILTYDTIHKPYQQQLLTPVRIVYTPS